MTLPQICPRVDNRTGSAPRVGHCRQWAETFFRRIHLGSIENSSYQGTQDLCYTL